MSLNAKRKALKSGGFFDDNIVEVAIAKSAAAVVAVVGAAII